jgi:hypothetical protein
MEKENYNITYTNSLCDVVWCLGMPFEDTTREEGRRGGERRGRGDGMEWSVE